MSDISTKIQFYFGHGIIENRNSVRFICEIEVGDGKQPALARWQGSGKQWSIFLMQWMPVRLAQIEVPTQCTFALGGDGTVGFGSGTYAEERINESTTGPKGRGPLRELRKIGTHLYAAGMGRQFYRRLGENHWEALDPKKIPRRGEVEVCGFTSVDGIDENDIWAVGYKGEIWNYKAGEWQQFPSPTNLTLHKVRMINPTLGFACGKKGIMLRYKRGNWEPMNNIMGAEDIWGIEWFNGNLYAASSDTLYVLMDDDTFEPLNIPNVSSFGHLHSADGVLWSFGTLQLSWSEDAQHWQEERPYVVE